MHRNNNISNSTARPFNNSNNASRSGFNGRSVIIDISQTNTPRVEAHMAQMTLAEASELDIENPENYDDNIQLIAFAWDHPEDLIQGYVDSYKGGIFSFSPTIYCGIALGTFANNTLSGLCTSIYNRISKIGLACSMPGCGDRIILPMLGAKECDITDTFGWFGSNTKIAEQFKQIANCFDLLSSLTNTCYRKIGTMDYEPEVSFLNKKDLAYHQNLYPKIKDGAIKAQRLNLSKNQHLNISKKAKAKGNVVHIGTDANNMSSQERMQAKRIALSNAQKLDSEQKNRVQENILSCLKRLEILRSIPSQMHPSKIQAYMIFETLLNHTYDVLTDFGKFSYAAGQYTDIIQDCLARTFCTFLYILDILLPYAKEITKALNIDLSQDTKLTELLEIKTIIPNSLLEEFQECEEVKAELAAIKRAKKAQTKTKQQSITTQVPTTAPQKDQSISLSLEERKIEDIARTKQAQANKRMTAQKAKDIQTARQQAEINRRTRGKEKVKGLGDRRLTQAQKMNQKHQQENLALEEAKTKARLESQVKVHHLPSDALIQDLISKLKGRHAVVFQMLFSEIENHNTMNDTDVVNLAAYFKDRLIQSGIGCAIDFYNYVVSRIHRRHNQDTGDLLPRDYAYILATCFIIFNIKPTGWVPKTTEDFDAEEKLLRRKADALYWSNKA